MRACIQQHVLAVRAHARFLDHARLWDSSLCVVQPGPATCVQYNSVCACVTACACSSSCALVSSSVRARCLRAWMRIFHASER